MSKHKQLSTLFLFPLLAIVFLSGCSNKKGMGSHVLSYDLSQITDLSISYDEENITFYESDSENLVIKEYMTKLDSSYYAKVDSNNQSIHISEGGKPFFKNGFTRYIEVYLPSSYKQNLTIRTTNGTIDLTNMPLQLSTLCIESTSGSVRIQEVSATLLSLSSTRGLFLPEQSKQIKSLLLIQRETQPVMYWRGPSPILLLAVI